MDSPQFSVVTFTRNSGRSKITSRHTHYSSITNHIMFKIFFFQTFLQSTRLSSTTTRSGPFPTAHQGRSSRSRWARVALIVNFFGRDFNERLNHSYKYLLWKKMFMFIFLTNFVVLVSLTVCVENKSQQFNNELFFISFLWLNLLLCFRKYTL